MKLINRYRAQREASRTRAAIARAIHANPSHALRQELETMAMR